MMRALTLLLISFACLSVLTAPAAPPVTEEKARPAGAERRNGLSRKTGSPFGTSVLPPIHFNL